MASRGGGGGFLGLLLWLRLLQPLLSEASGGAAAGPWPGEGDRAREESGATLAGSEAPSPAAPRHPKFPKTLAVAPVSPAPERPPGSRGSAEPTGDGVLEAHRISTSQKLFPPACGHRSMRVIGGNIVPERKWPWQVSLQTQKRHVCGGSLISNRWVMTAAHCITGVRDYQVMLGHNVLYSTLNPTTVVAEVKDIVSHPFYDVRNLQHDVALVLLDSPVDYSPYIQPVCLPERPFKVETGTLCWVTGWGRIENNALTVLLREAEQKIVLQNTCNKYFQKWFQTSASLVLKGMICGHHEEVHSPCKGDSGGPLVCEFNRTWTQVGIVSWGVDCGKDLPSVYTEVIEYKEWVKGIVSEAPCMCSLGACVLFVCLVLHLGILVTP